MSLMMTVIAPASPAANPIVILVAEDNKFDRMILEQAFSELGYDLE